MYRSRFLMCTDLKYQHWPKPRIDTPRLDSTSTFFFFDSGAALERYSIENARSQAIVLSLLHVPWGAWFSDQVISIALQPSSLSRLPASHVNIFIGQTTAVQQRPGIDLEMTASSSVRKYCMSSRFRFFNILLDLLAGRSPNGLLQRRCFFWCRLLRAAQCLFGDDHWQTIPDWRSPRTSERQLQ